MMIIMFQTWESWRIWSHYGSENGRGEGGRKLAGVWEVGLGVFWWEKRWAQFCILELQWQLFIARHLEIWDRSSCERLEWGKFWESSKWSGRWTRGATTCILKSSGNCRQLMGNPSVVWTGPVDCGHSHGYSTMGRSCHGGLSQWSPLALPIISFEFIYFFLPISISFYIWALFLFILIVFSLNVFLSFHSY